MADEKSTGPAWEVTQVKTFTKWCNTHLGKSGKAKIDDLVTDWDTGLNLINLAVALYNQNEKEPEKAISYPKLKDNELNAKNRIQRVQVCSKAISLLKSAGVDVRTVSAENLVDHDKIAILGMVWIIILDYASRGFGGTAAEVKRALLEWVNKKTEGYEEVNPPGVKNFTKDWKSGLAWCALIHRHRPELLDYQACIGRSNAENLEQAFQVAEDHLDIPRLLDVVDVDCAAPDEKSILTYVLEYFHAFANEGLKENAAKQAAEWLKFMREIQQQQFDYERRATALLEFCSSTEQGWSGYNFGSNLSDAQDAFRALRSWVTTLKPQEEAEKMDVEALFAEIQTTLKVNGLNPYVPAAGLEPDDIEAGFANLSSAQSGHGRAVRQNRFKYIEKKEDTGAVEILEDIKKAFDHYDENGNQQLNPIEFGAACMEMGIALRTQEEKEALFRSVSGDDSDINFDNYKDWMVARMIVRLDDPEGIKNAFKVMAGGATGLTEAQLAIQPMSDEDVAFMKANMSQDENGLFDYNGFVQKFMGSN
jgi:Ca2+-binding EF-hand superfamily protein